MTKARHLKNNKKLFDTFKWKLLSSTFLWYCLLCYDKEVLPLESLDEILGCDHSNESYWTGRSCGTVYYAVQGSSNFWVRGWNPMVWSFNVSSWTVLSCGDVYHVVQRCSKFESVDEILWHDHSNESYWSLSSCGTEWARCVFKRTWSASEGCAVNRHRVAWVTVSSTSP